MPKTGKIRLARIRKDALSVSQDLITCRRNPDQREHTAQELRALSQKFTAVAFHLETVADDIEAVKDNDPD